MWKVKVLVSHSCPTLCNSMDWSIPGFSVHGILQARVPEWVAITFSRESSQPRDWTRVSRIAGRFFTIWATREVQVQCKHFINSCQFAAHSSFAFFELSEILFFKNIFHQWLVEFMDVELIDTESHLYMKRMWKLIYLINLVYTDVFHKDSNLYPVLR